jgi:hypothetical protein
MIGQNPSDQGGGVKASHHFTGQEYELKTNTQLTMMIHDLAKEIHASMWKERLNVW